MALGVRQRVGIFIGLALAVILLLALLLVRGKMQHDLWEITSLAELSYPQAEEPVAALLVWIQAPTHSIEERNRGVWALGQMGDQRALPVLEQYYHGGTCDHENELCQRELEKAIKLIREDPFRLIRLSPRERGSH